MERERQPSARSTLKVIAGLTVAGLAGAGLLANLGSEAARGVKGSPARHLLGPSQETSPLLEAPARELGDCSKYPYLKFVGSLYKNLGNKGTDHGHGEGLVYETTDLGAGAGAEYGRKVLLIVNATSPYKPFSPRMNGMQGKYASININSGSSVDLEISFRDEKRDEHLLMKELAFTFFDLDTGLKGTSVESVTINKFTSKHLTANTEVQVDDIGNGFTKFSASTYGTGEDNPTDPMRLTGQQKNRAVTLMFKDVRHIKVKLAASAGRGPRFFTFVARPSLLCAVTVSENSKPPLPDLDFTPPSEVPVAVHGDKRIFVRYTKNVGDHVDKGDTVAIVKEEDGTEHLLKATCAGKVVRQQSGLNPGEKCDERLSDRTIVVIEEDKIPPLPVDSDSAKGAVGEDGETFVEYDKDVGDVVSKGDAIATVKDADGTEQKIDASKDGIVSEEQEDIEKGDPIEEIEDENLAVITKFDPLRKDPDDAASNAEPGCKFVKYMVKKGDLVEQADPIAKVTDSSGQEKMVTASRAGVVTDIQDDLEPGMSIDDTMQDKNLATIGKLPRLHVGTGEAGCTAPTDEQHKWKFLQWKAKVGDNVEKGDPIAVVENNQGLYHTVKASKAGTVKERQEHLRPGYEIAKVMKDTNLAVIGKFPAMKADGFREVAVKVPEGAIFKKYYVKTGDHVELGDSIAQVEIPGSRRLMDGEPRRLGKLVDVPSPGWGTVTKEQPLKADQPIHEQQVGPNIAVVDLGPPWWLLLLGALGALAGMLCCLFAVMKKPKPAYTPMPPVEEPPEPEPVIEEPKPEPPPEPVPDGLRLDFEDNGTVNTVYAKWRPLGIKHNFSAPIIAHDFTVNSYAKQDLGVKDGWKLRRIGDEELNNNPNFKEVDGKLVEYMKDFPLWPLPLEFQEDPHDPSSARRTVKFTERPIGLEFSNKAPIKVSKVYDGSTAQEQGVQEGWKIVKIGDCDVSENSNFREVMHYFKEGVIPLDESGKKFS